jgi:protoporphyrin/coproporphyrin ferrochelatase
MAYGAANSLDEVGPYLADIRAGRPPNPELIEEVKRRYQMMGGKSPLLDITKRQAKAVQDELNRGGGAVSVYIGMRHWHPYIKDTVATMAKEGVRKMVAMCLTPYYSKMSVGAYYKQLDAAVSAAGGSFEISRVESWNDHPLLIGAIAEKVRKALDRFPKEIQPKVPILFSAHSLPERILNENDPYPNELAETVGMVMQKIGGNPHRFAYQSQGRTPEPWLGPEAGAVINELYDQGHRHLLMAPIGFISDHMETLYDVDVMYREQCEAKKMRLERAESLNDTPQFIQAIAATIREHLS